MKNSKVKSNTKSNSNSVLIIILAVCAIVGLIVTFVKFFEDSDRKYSYTNVYFTFEGSADGQTPGGKTFDVNLIKDESVVEEALVSLGLNDKYTAENIVNSIVIEGVYSDSVASQILSYISLLDFSGSSSYTLSSYHATQYNIKLYNDFDKNISDDDMSSLLNAIVDSFEKNFSINYAFVWEGDIINLGTNDYSQQLDVIEERISQISRYAGELYLLDQSNLVGNTGFDDIYIRVNALADSELPRLRAYITMEGLTKDSNRLITQYYYEIEALQISLKNQKERLANVESLLDSYEKNEVIYISTGDTLTKIDGNSSQTYDWLVAERKEIADSIAEINTNIEGYQLKINDIVGDSETAETEPDVQDTDAEAETTAGDLSDDVQTEVDAETEAETETETEKETEAEAETTAGESEIYEFDVAYLEKSIDSLKENIDSIESDFSEMLTAYNSSKINSTSMKIADVAVDKKQVVSGAFIKAVIQYAGPFVALGVIICIVIIIIRKVRKAKV
ncbi:MAG: hypothetical protein K6F92_04230 [Lachnospiraceae bacterium]|nr:hypothetical protein [Lachnospiraceae bacterium]